MLSSHTNDQPVRSPVSNADVLHELPATVVFEHVADGNGLATRACPRNDIP
jgi:hypothetical protein